MSTDNYASVFWQDGQQLDLDGLNLGQRFVRAQLTDQILERCIAGVANSGFSGSIPELMGRVGTDAPSDYAYAVNPGGAFLRAGSGNNKVQIAPGTLLQKIANSDGQDSTLVPFFFSGTEEFTIANGDATNPRVDLLQMKLEYISDTPTSVDFQDAVSRALTTVAATSTRRRIRCTLSTKQGTPAVSPVVPDPDTGNVAVGSVVVGHGYITSFGISFAGIDVVDTNNAVVHDQRMPLGVSVFRVDPTAYKLETAWALASTNQVVTASSTTNKFYAHCPAHLGRLIALEMRTNTAPTAGAITLGSLPNGMLAAPSTVFVKGNTLGTASGTLPVQRFLRGSIDGAHNPAAGPVIQPSAVAKIGVPLWTGGFRVPGSPGWLGMGVVNQGGLASIGEIGFYLAMGL